MDGNDKHDGALSFSTITIAVVLLVALLAGSLGIATAYFMHHSAPLFQPTSISRKTTDYRSIPTQWLGYLEKAVFPCNVVDSTCFAASRNGNWFIGTKTPPAVQCFSADGNLLRTISLDEAPMCLAVGQEETPFADRLLIGFLLEMKVYSLAGEKLADWQYLEEHRTVWSLVPTDQAVFVVDSQTGQIASFDENGRFRKKFASLASQIAKKENKDSADGQTENEFPGFVVYRSPISMSFSSKNGLLYVANPGRHQVEAFTQDGYWESSLSWGGASAEIVGFAGCCNPVDLDVLEDGRLVTAEKSISRVKIFHPDGKLDTVVAGPDILESKPSGIPELASLPNRSISQNNDQPVMIAALKDNSILVFDPVLKIVRRFEPK